MAFSNALLERMNAGNKQVQFYSCVADGATGTIVTGMKSVDAVAITPKSFASTPVHTAINAGVSGTSTAGTIAVTGAASGDEFYMLVYGH